jgi:hypothetical protein
VLAVLGNPQAALATLAGIQVRYIHGHVVRALRCGLLKGCYIAGFWKYLVGDGQQVIMHQERAYATSGGTGAVGRGI